MGAPANLLIGQAGVYRVASELLRRGVDVFFPAVDIGVDLITDSGKRLQVKAANSRTRVNKATGTLEAPAYYMSLSGGTLGSKRKWVSHKRRYSDEIDYFIIWGIAEDRFWIIPAAILDNKQMLKLNVGCTESKNSGDHIYIDKVYACENCWHFIAGGDIRVDTPAPQKPVSEI